ncbi:hybrid sensor histidine kinase/response regulator, partial [Bradyrhizobium sp. NBAIM16]|nr:hybrid sensor histidine kinase/response regulator [Bradyrhizobium sp. NBAIM16]
TLMGKFRDGMPVTAEAVTVILSSIDRIKEILAGLEATEAEPEGNDRDLIDKLEAMVEQGMAAMSGSAQPMPTAGTAAPVADAPPLVPEAPAAAAAPAKEMTMGTLVDQTLERPLRPGEVSLDELERAFRETAVEAPAPVAQAEAKAEPAAEAPVAKEAVKPKEKAAPKKSMADEMAGEGDRIANQSIRVNVDTLEHLMTMVSELVLTRNQLLEISRRN